MSGSAAQSATGNPAAPTPVLDVNHLAVGYESGRVLADVDLHLGPGEVVALMGANGSGKSTLVKTILGITKPTKGSVHIFGVPTTNRRALPWDRIGYVPQRLTATSGVPATALETVMSGLLTRTRLRTSRDWTAKAMAALDDVGLVARAKEPVHTFSGGQQQRVLLARALVREPDLLVLDEPLSGMDQPSREHTFEILQELVAQDTTILVVLHEVEPLESLISRAVVLRHGRIVHDGAVPTAAAGHNHDHHDHVHPHGDADPYIPGPRLNIQP